MDLFVNHLLPQLSTAWFPLDSDLLPMVLMQRQHSKEPDHLKLKFRGKLSTAEDTVCPQRGRRKASAPSVVAARVTGFLCQERDAAAASVSGQLWRSNPGRAEDGHG